LQPIDFPDIVTCLVYSPDGTLAVALINGALYITRSGDKPARINTDEEKVGYFDNSDYLSFSPDGKTLAAASERTIQIWDVAGGKLKKKIKAGRSIVRRLVFHPNGKMVAAAGDTADIVLWDIDTGKEVRRFDWGIGKKILSLAIAPDGLTAAAGGSNKKFVVWDLDEAP
jgi:WD40 repeat protein